MSYRKLFVPSMTLFFILFGIYWLSYSGIHFSNDERYLYDSSESFVRRGDFRLTYLFDLRPKADVLDGTPWNKSLHEPLQPILASPLFWLAEKPPSIGLMHTVWLFNIFVTVLIALLFFWGGVLQGYRIKVAWLGALLLGLATMLWPYSRTFFREPLMTFFTLICFLAAISIQRNWAKGHLAWDAIIFLFVGFAGVFLSKAAGLLILPALMIILLPSPKILTSIYHRRQLFWAFAILILLVLTVLGIMRYVGADSNRFRVDKWFVNLSEFEWKYVVDSLLGYEISPARSIWLFSPILILGLWGGTRLIRQGDWRIVAGPIVGIILLTISYGVTLYAEWWGGQGWGPRYLLPYIPILMLWVLPVLNEALAVGSRLYLRLTVLALIIVSISVQLIGVWGSVAAYYQHLSEQKVIVWEDGLWDWQWSPIWQNLNLLKLSSPDFAWSYSQHPISTLIAVTILIITISIGWQFSHYRWHYPRYIDSLLGIGLLVCSAISIAIGLYQLRDDPRYTLSNPDALPMVDVLNDKANKDEAVFIEENGFQLGMMNWLKSPNLVVTLPYAAGESFNPEVNQTVSDLPLANQLGTGSALAMTWAAEHYEGLWVVLGKNYGIPYALRPTEHFLAEKYYLIERIVISDFAVLAHFYPLPAPVGTPSIASNIHFADQLTLIGFDLPEGANYKKGDIVPVSLAWEIIQDLDSDYGVSVQIAQNGAAPVVNIDGLPQATFGYTSRWEMGQLYRDHYGLKLPDNLKAGEYNLQVIVYSYPDIERLPIINGAGEIVSDIAILQVIKVE